MSWCSGSVAAITVACLFVASMAAQAEMGAPSAAPDAEAAAAMRQKITTPSRAHKRLDVFVGVWAGRMSLWMDPSQPPATSEGTFEQKWILEGRFLQQTYQGELMGRPFSGVGYIGYDNYLKRYLSTWMDSAGTTIHTRTGKFDEEGRTLTLTGEIDDYVRGKSIPVRDRMVVVGPSEFVFETWEPGPDGKDFKIMEARFTRKADAAGPSSDQARQAVTKIVAQVQKADYEGDRKALLSLAAALAPYAENGPLTSRALYWRGFAMWRRAFNGFNDSVDPKELERDLTEAVKAFTDATAKDPDFVDAKVGASSCLFTLAFLNKDDAERRQGYLTEGIRLLGEARKAAPENPRFLWVEGGGLWYVPAERGGGQAKAIEAYERGLEFARNQKGRVSDPLEPSWGEPELLMNLAWSHLNRSAPDINAAESNARAALALVPNWHYVRDILLPQIRAKATGATPTPPAGDTSRKEASPTDFDFLEGESFLRITYYDIARDRFRWKADVSNDGGKTWRSDQIRIEARRAPDSGSPTP